MVSPCTRRGTFCCASATTSDSSGQRATVLLAERCLREKYLSNLLFNVLLSKVIPAFEMVMRARANVYHLECFACQQCGHRFCVGDQFYLHDNQVTNNLNICQTEQPALSGALWSGLRGADGLRLPLLTPTTSCSTQTWLPGKLPSPASKSKLEWSSSCSTEARQQFQIFYSIPLSLIISTLLSTNAPPANTDYVTNLKKYTT